jgi:hypothetical protein
MEMSAEADLREKIERLRARGLTQRDTRRDEMCREMSRLEVLLERFESLARRWMDDLVVPRLQTLAVSFPNSAPMVIRNCFAADPDHHRAISTSLKPGGEGIDHVNGRKA